MKGIEKHPNEHLSIVINGKLIVFNSRDLTILEGCNGTTRIYIEGEQVYESSYHLGHFVKQFKKYNMHQSHRSFYINIFKVKAYNLAEETILMKNNITVPLSKKYKHEILNILNDWKKESREEKVI